jgi:hypothetical protein
MHLLERLILIGSMVEHMKRYQYRFFLLSRMPYWTSKKVQAQYRSIIEEHARDGWRLVQILAPSKGFYIVWPRYYEIIFEREIETARS